VAAPAPAAGPAEDPNIDRGFLLPTAMTQPKGTLTYNNYELLLHGLSYGITDHVQVTATVLSPITKEMPFVGIAAVKAQVVDAGLFHLAVQGSVTYADRNAAFGPGLLASVCLRDDCSSLLSGSVTYQIAGLGDDHTAHMFLYGSSLLLRVSDHVKLLAELTSAAGGQSDRFENIDGMLVSYGVRLHSGRIAGDVGFIKPVSTSGEDFDLLMGIPFINFSYRW
jgi:hypothetical protein